jgi:LPXTG-site transpeptidase (sortase) family protein
MESAPFTMEHKIMNSLLSKFDKTKTSLSLGFSMLILGAGLMLLTWSPWNNRSVVAANQLNGSTNSNLSQNNTQPIVAGTPTHILIPSAGINLKVIPGYYYPSSASWTLSLNDAQYGVMTAKANNKEGLTYIYAHYRKNVFMTLAKVKTGDQVYVTTDNGHTFTYSYRNSITTSPNDTSIFKYQGKPILVLQTCSGAWYQNRQLFIFDLQKVN